MTDTLHEFLLARIAEDEAYMQAETGRAETAPIYAGLPPMLEQFAAIDICVSPERWRAECEGKRWVVETFGVTDYSRYNDPEIIRRLALPYAGHPDYRQEWRPRT